MHLVSCPSYWLPPVTQGLHTPEHHLQVPLETILLVLAWHLSDFNISGSPCFCFVFFLLKYSLQSQ